MWRFTGGTEFGTIRFHRALEGPLIVNEHSSFTTAPTITFVGKSSGLSLQFKIANGPILKRADGKPIRSAGTITVTETIDAATGETLSFTVDAEHGRGG